MSDNRWIFGRQSAHQREEDSLMDVGFEVWIIVIGVLLMIVALFVFIIYIAVSLLREQRRSSREGGQAQNDISDHQ